MFENWPDNLTYNTTLLLYKYQNFHPLSGKGWPFKPNVFFNKIIEQEPSRNNINSIIQHSASMHKQYWNPSKQKFYEYYIQNLNCS